MAQELDQEAKSPGLDFIRTAIKEDFAQGRFINRVHTRFPPEPNGYLHIGHAKSICLNFGIASEDEQGLCNLRFDDTNPTKEEQEFVDSIKEDIKWLGFDWEDREYYASDYFPQLYEWARELIKKDLAYIDSQTPEEISLSRGTPTKAGTNSPYRNRPMEENLDLFERMKNGEFEDGSHVLRAKIDMAHSNLYLRDPVLYRIKHAHHHRTGNDWCIYPMYDWAHGQSDAIEEITHSICTLEFENHRPLYDWFLEKLGLEHAPRQIEFNRLNITYCVLSKRKLTELVTEKKVTGWDDPRMPTISGMRRRGYTPQAIRNLVKEVGVSKTESMVEYELVEHFVREDLNNLATRVMVIKDPIKLTISNYPQDQEELLDADNNPEDHSAGKRKIPFSANLFVEREDFREDAPRKWFRLAPGKEVRLKHAYYVTCNEVIKDDAGKVVELVCSYDPQSRGGWTDDGRKVKGTIQWVSEKHAVDIEVHQYDKLYTEENLSALPENTSHLDYLNPDSFVKLIAKGEPSLLEAKPYDKFQFIRNAYYTVDPKLSQEGAPVFNRTVTLRDSWAKIEKKLG